MVALACDASVFALARGEIFRWLGHDIDIGHAIEELNWLNENKSTTVLFKVSGGELSFIQKRSFYTDEELHTGLPAHIPYRANLYKSLIAPVIGSVFRSQETVFAIELEDGGYPTKNLPIFSFQKHKDSNNLLLPDVDFIYNDFFEEEKFVDTVPFEDKVPKVVFSGSTTGIFNTHETLDAHLNPRLRAGVRFQGSPFVDFRLPNIVMCSDESVVTRIRDMGFGSGHTTWEEQFRSRYLLSMDGNGATCSRVALGLRSNSVLLKYDSPHILFYFRNLIPWIHYIPVSEDEDVETIFRMGERDLSYLKEISQNASVFYKNFLVKEKITDYLKFILNDYFEFGPKFNNAHLSMFDSI